MYNFKEPIEIKKKKINKPKPLKQKVEENIKLDDKELAKKMLSPYLYTDRNLTKGFNINLESHHNNHASSKWLITPKYLKFGTEIRHTKKTLKQMAIIFAISRNQYIFKHQTVFSARFAIQNEGNQIIDGTELFINLNITPNITESDLDSIDVQSSLEKQIRNQEMKDFGWRFDKIDSMTIYFYETGEMNGTSFVKIHLRSSAILNIQNY